MTGTTRMSAALHAGSMPPAANVRLTDEISRRLSRKIELRAISETFTVGASPD